MKKIFSLILVFCIMLGCSVSLTSCSQTESTVDKLVVYNWSDYIYDYEDDFKQYYKSITGRDINVTYVTFDTNETMMTKITKGDSKVDVMCPSEYTIQKLMQMDMLVPLNYFSDDVNDYLNVNSLKNKEEYVHNSSNIEEAIIEKISEGFNNLECVKSNGDKYNANMIDYMVPYMYGTLGILYNKYKFIELGIYDEEILNRANWGILFNDSGLVDENGERIPLSEDLSGSILMKNSVRDTYAATLFYLVESGKLDGFTTADGRKYKDIPVSELINIIDDNIIEVCKEVLVDQKSELFGYEVDFGKDDLLQGNAYVDLAWSGDALYAVEESWNDDLNDGEGDYELNYYIPHSSGNIWFDGWVIPKSYDKSHETAIKLFINFLNTPYVAAQNMLEIGYTSAVSSKIIEEDDEAMAALVEGYYVYAPEYYEFSENELMEANDGEYDFESIEEFKNYYFYNLNSDDEYFDEIGKANWRYPFLESDEEFEYKRTSEDLGMMRDFEGKNKDVVSLWNYVRSAGQSVFPIFCIVILSMLAVFGLVALVYYISYRRRLRVKIK